MEEIKELKYEFAWRGRDIAQQANDRLDSKAVNIINFSCLLIPIITGILFFALKESVISKYNYIFLIWSIILLIISIFFAFLTIWLRDQGIIVVNDFFDKLSAEVTVNEAKGRIAMDIAIWQKKIIDASKKKRINLLISSGLFILAMVLIFFSAISFYFNNSY